LGQWCLITGALLLLLYQCPENTIQYRIWVYDAYQISYEVTGQVPKIKILYLNLDDDSLYIERDAVLPWTKTFYGQRDTYFSIGAQNIFDSTAFTIRVKVNEETYVARSDSGFGRYMMLNGLIAGLKFSHAQTLSY